MDNAIKYGGDNTKITLSSHQDDEFTYVNVEDNGPGISPKHLERIFERFYRVQGDNQKTIEGKGLGLSMVKHIFLKHDAETSVSSEMNKGTTFHIKLPLES